MRFLLRCDGGAAGACAAEAREFLEVESLGDDYVIVSGSGSQAARLVWHSQTIHDALIILAEDCALDDLNRDSWPEDACALIKGSFAVRSPEGQLASEEWGGALKEALGLEVDLDAPDVLFVPLQTGGSWTLGLSLTKRDLRKRCYRVFTSNTSLRPTIAAAALRLCGYSGVERLLIAYETDGTLAIEAALLATRLGPYRYDGLVLPWGFEPLEEREASVDVAVSSVPSLKAVQKNAKIAGVHKALKVTKAELDWLDTKYEEDSFRIVVSFLPSSSKKRSPKDAGALADELGFQARFVLERGGLLGVLSLKPEEHSSSLLGHGFVERERITLMMGGQQVFLLVLEVE